MNEAEHNASGPRQGSRAAAGGATTLREEHRRLMDAVKTRAELVLREADEDRWPQRELHELLNYLHLEVLRQVTDSEWLLFRAAYLSPDELAGLRRDHLELRLAIDVLTQAGAIGGGVEGLSSRRLAAAIRDLLAQLDGHLAAEEQLLAAVGKDAPTAMAAGSRPHEWYTLTEGAVIDLDQLPGEQGIDAVLGRLLRLEADEHVELRCSADPSPLCQRLTRTDPGGYGLAYLEGGPRRWRLQITRRSAQSTPHPLA